MRPPPGRDYAKRQEAPLTNTGRHDLCSDCIHLARAGGFEAKTAGASFIIRAEPLQSRCMLELKPIDGWCPEHQGIADDSTDCWTPAAPFPTHHEHQLC